MSPSITYTFNFLKRLQDLCFLFGGKVIKPTGGWVGGDRRDWLLRPLKGLNNPFGAPAASKTQCVLSNPARLLTPLYSPPKKIPCIIDAGDCFWRRERDSNPRNAINAYTLSRRAPSATRTPHRTLTPNYLLNKYQWDNQLHHYL